MTENETADFFIFPPCRSKLIAMCETDSNHFPESDSDLLYWMPDFRDLDYRGHGERWVQNHGIRPRNVEPEKYEKGARVYPASFQFYPGMICTESVIVGNRHTTSEEGCAYLARLYESMAIVKIGRIVSTGNWNEYKLSLEGVDIIFGTLNVARNNCVRPLDDKGCPAHVPVGLLYMTCDSICLSRCSPSMISAGKLVPEICFAGGAAGLVEQGRIIPAGSLHSEFANFELVPAVAELYRAIAVIDADCRMRGDGERRTDEQDAYIGKLFAVAIESARSTK